jgi:hypothetical protein
MPRSIHRPLLLGLVVLAVAAVACGDSAAETPATGPDAAASTVTAGSSLEGVTVEMHYEPG